MDLKQFFKSKGFDVVATDTMENHLESWKSWYSGDVTNFHNYTIYNGSKKVPCKRLGLQMAKKVCEDWANMLMNEKVEFVIDGSETTSKNLNAVLFDNDFWTMANRGVELSFGLGTGAFVLGLNDITYDAETDTADTSTGQIRVEFIPAHKIFPLSYEGNNVAECGFATKKRLGKETLVFVSMHVKNDKGNYVIQNYVLRESKGGGGYTDVTDKQVGFLPEFDTRSETPWFTIYRPNIINNVEFDNPYGISVFANSISTLKSIDIIYDSFANEFLLGRKRIFVSSEVTKVDITTGESKLVFDPNDVVFYSIPPDMDGKGMITDTDMSIRSEDHEKGLIMQFNVLSAKCGFGERHYKFDNGSVSTATQIISENSTLFRTVKKHEILLESCLYDLFKGIMYIGNTFTGQAMDENAKLTINFDDSIIEDKNSEMTRDLQLVNGGIMQKWEFRVKYFGEDEETAKKNIPETPSLFGVNDTGV
jgi:A118 family predicted phage portal protein